MGDIEDKILLIGRSRHTPSALARLVEQARERPLSWDDCLLAWRRLARRAPASPPPGLALYLHVPLCAERCSYCECTTRKLETAGELERLVACLEHELEHAGEILSSHPLSALSAGGGTPSLLSEDHVERVLSRALARARRAPGFHFNVEMNPQSTTPGKLTRWRAHGASRVSFGVQTMTRPVLEQIRRAYQTFERVARAVEDARRVGFDAVNIDLVAGLPGETEESFAATLDLIVSLVPDTVTIYRWMVNDSCIEYRTAGPLTADGAEVRERILRSVARCVRGGPSSSIYDVTELTAVGVDLMRHSADRFHATAHYEKVRSRGGSVLAMGHGASSVVEDALGYAHAMSWSEYLTWPNRPVERPYRGAPAPPARAAMASHWALGIEAGPGVDRDEIRRRFGTAPEEAFADEVRFLLSSGIVELSGGRYRLAPGRTFAELSIAGALLFSLEDLDDAVRRSVRAIPPSPRDPARATEALADPLRRALLLDLQRRQAAFAGFTAAEIGVSHDDEILVTLARPGGGRVRLMIGPHAPGVRCYAAAGALAVTHRSDTPVDRPEKQAAIRAFVAYLRGFQSARPAR